MPKKTKSRSGRDLSRELDSKSSVVENTTHSLPSQSSPINVVIVAAKDGPASEWVIVKRLAHESGAHLINKLGFNLPDLLFVSHHRIVKTPSILLMREGEVVFRYAGLLPAARIQALKSELAQG